MDGSLFGYVVRQTSTAVVFEVAGYFLSAQPPLYASKCVSPRQFAHSSLRQWVEEGDQAASSTLGAVALSWYLEN